MKGPKLRFRDEDGGEFPEWDIVNLGEIAQKINLKNKRLQEKKVLTNSATQGVVSQSDYFDRDIANKNNLEGYYIVNIDDFVYNPRISSTAPVGPIKRNKLCTGVMSPLYTVFQFKENNLTFMECFFDTTLWHDYMKSVANYGVRHDRMNITNDAFFALPILLPSLKEQTKIANFLTAVDEKITQLTRKHELLTQYKKSVMQQIFSQKLRFRDEDGLSFPEWDIVNLGEIAQKINLKNKRLQEKKVLTNSATQGVVSQSDYFDRDIANKNNLEGYYIVNIDDFVYNPRISSTAPVGPIKRNKLCTGVMSPLYTIFQFKENNLTFMECFFDTTLWHDYMKSIANYGARHDRMNITNDAFFALPILLPSIKEQTKIANFLTAIDQKISHAQAELDSLQNYKRGLLQQMFI